MRHFVACIFFLLFACSTYGQNMVLNPSFEQHLQCPTYSGQFSSAYVVNWANLSEPNRIT